MKKYKYKIEQKENVEPEDIFEEINQFLNIIKENHDIIQSTKKKGIKWNNK